VAASALPDLVVAYEPIWAIGTGDTARRPTAQAMHATISAADRTIRRGSG